MMASSGLLTGLSMAKLVDMDGDGTPELYCGAGLDGQHMYSYADGKIYALDIPEGVSNFGTDVFRRAPSFMWTARKPISWTAMRS